LALEIGYLDVVVGRMLERADLLLRWVVKSTLKVAVKKKAIQLLLGKEVDINARDRCGRSALHWVCRQRSDDKGIVELLVNNRADVNARDKDGRTALHWVCEDIGGGGEETLGFLLKNGADIKAKDKNGSTVLHLAARRERKEILKLLLQNGADINERDGNGLTALDHARENRPARDVLLSSGAKFDANNSFGQLLGREEMSRILEWIMKIRQGDCLRRF
jgi:ankyrin repeat protein